MSHAIETKSSSLRLFGSSSHKVLLNRWWIHQSSPTSSYLNWCDNHTFVIEFISWFEERDLISRADWLYYAIGTLVPIIRPEIAYLVSPVALSLIGYIQHLIRSWISWPIWAASTQMLLYVTAFWWFNLWKRQKVMALITKYHTEEKNQISWRRRWSEEAGEIRFK